MLSVIRYTKLVPNMSLRSQNNSNPEMTISEHPELIILKTRLDNMTKVSSLFCLLASQVIYPIPAPKSVLIFFSPISNPTEFPAGLPQI